MTWNPVRLLGVVAVVVLGAAFFSCLSVAIAGVVLKRDRLMGDRPGDHDAAVLRVERAVPGGTHAGGWVQAISRVNPLSYEVSALRGLLIGQPTNYWLDFGGARGSRGARDRHRVRAVGATVPIAGSGHEATNVFSSARRRSDLLILPTPVTGNSSTNTTLSGTL